LEENVLYAATNGTNGREWWISDGTEVGTNILKDINAGTGNGIISQVVTNFNNKLYFPADDGQNGIELHVSDGTENGTMLLKDLTPGTSSSQITRLFTPLGKLFFMANDGFGSDLWTTDGTEQGTKLIKEIGPILSFDVTRGMYVIGSKFIFTPQSANGTELWVSDGTEANTMEIVDLNPGIASGHLQSRWVRPMVLSFSGEMMEQGLALKSGERMALQQVPFYSRISIRVQVLQIPILSLTSMVRSFSLQQIRKARGYGNPTAHLMAL